MNELTVENLSMSYRGSKVLNGSFFKIQSGRINCIVGRNGCGKSTFIKAILGLLKDSTEDLYINGVRISKRNRINIMAYLSQQSFLPKNTKVKNIIKVFLPADKQNELRSEDRIRTILNRKAGQLSGGERKYLEFFLISSLDREVYIFDEPFIGIEPLYIDNVRTRLFELKEAGKFIILTDHNFHSVKSVADRIWLSRSGVLVAEAKDREELLRNCYLPENNSFI